MAQRRVQTNTSPTSWDGRRARDGTARRRTVRGAPHLHMARIWIKEAPPSTVPRIRSSTSPRSDGGATFRSVEVAAAAIAAASAASPPPPPHPPDSRHAHPNQPPPALELHKIELVKPPNASSSTTFGLKLAPYASPKGFAHRRRRLGPRSWRCCRKLRPVVYWRRHPFGRRREGVGYRPRRGAVKRSMPGPVAGSRGRRHDPPCCLSSHLLRSSMPSSHSARHGRRRRNKARSATGMAARSTHRAVGPPAGAAGPAALRHDFPRMWGGRDLAHFETTCQRLKSRCRGGPRSLRPRACLQLRCGDQARLARAWQAHRV